jgi:hypothetical protein
MEPAVRLAWSATIAARFVEALARGSAPGGDSRDGRLAEGVAAYAGLGAGELAETRNSVLGGRERRQNLVAAAADWAVPIDEALAAGRTLPPALAALVDGIGPATLDPLAGDVYARVSAKWATDADEAALYRRLLGTPVPAQADPQRRRRRRILLAGAGVLAVALVAWLVIRSVGPDEEELPDSASGLRFVCAGTVFPDAAAYAGAGPHPTALLAVNGSVNPSQVVHDEKNAALFSPAWKAERPAEIQAVACLSVDETMRNTVDTCEYSDPRRPGLAQPTIPLPMYRGEYTVTMYETRTGRRIHQATISGEVMDCPTSVPVGTSHVYTEPSAQQYLDAIGHYVNG